MIDDTLSLSDFTLATLTLFIPTTITGQSLYVHRIFMHLFAVKKLWLSCISYVAMHQGH